ncbi:MerR family transcriptional regulator [Actinoallomurus spadix]|uniref:MerR family transcriptional regulator n=1 Tax=Actinoallomurus spadix TaxID=79912 RepID=A0ABN0WDQ7_9ACTN|nr:MerR family transcriptional regulator [Actinoallomurus spadix]MCO5987183.1 MerR family transcriptional regulator [Actinoallomurus spadix]
MRIGELSRRTSVSTRLLRYYEEQGLLVPERLPNGYREYAEDAPMIVAQIRGLLDAGLSTDVIRELLPCAEGKRPRLTGCPELRDILRQSLERMQSRIDALTHNRDALLRYLEAAETVASAQG